MIEINNQNTVLGDRFNILTFLLVTCVYLCVDNRQIVYLCTFKVHDC